MHESNRYYGHDAILRAYCGVHPRRHVAGVVQHGWTPFEWLDVHRSWLRQMPLYVWNDTVRAQSLHAGARQAVTIGSPFAYLLELIGDLEPAERHNVLVLPYHGLSDGDEEGTVRELIEQAAHREDRARIVVYLHANEMSDGRLLDVCSEHGVAVRSFWRGQHSLRDPYLLLRQIHEFRRATRVVSNSISTPLWYAAHLGAATAVYGPAPRRQWVPSQGNRILVASRERWPFMFADAADHDPMEAARVARAELGADRLLAPDELRRVLGFSSVLRQGSSNVIAGGADLRRSLRDAFHRVGT